MPFYGFYIGTSVMHWMGHEIGNNNNNNNAGKMCNNNVFFEEVTLSVVYFMAAVFAYGFWVRLLVIFTIEFV